MCLVSVVWLTVGSFVVFREQRIELAATQGNELYTLLLLA